MKTHAPLSGITVLVTRAAHQAGDLVRAIEERGGKAAVLPTIDILPPASWSACDEAIDGIDA